MGAAQGGLLPESHRVLRGEDGSRYRAEAGTRQEPAAPVQAGEMVDQVRD